MLIVQSRRCGRQVCACGKSIACHGAAKQRHAKHRKLMAKSLRQANTRWTRALKLAGIKP